MPRTKGKTTTTTTKRKMRPAMSPEARENQLISLAVDLAEKQLMEGTASAQVITHYLKLGTVKEKRELEKLEEDIKLLRAKTDAIQTAERVEQKYEAAIQAMMRYSGQSYDDSEEEDYDDYEEL